MDNVYEVDVPSEIFAAVKLDVEHMKVVEEESEAMKLEASFYKLLEEGDSKVSLTNAATKGVGPPPPEYENSAEKSGALSPDKSRVLSPDKSVSSKGGYRNTSGLKKK